MLGTEREKGRPQNGVEYGVSVSIKNETHTNRSIFPADSPLHRHPTPTLYPHAQSYTRQSCYWSLSGPWLSPNTAIQPSPPGGGWAAVPLHRPTRPHSYSARIWAHFLTRHKCISGSTSPTGSCPLRGQKDTVSISHCVMLGKLVNLYEPQFFFIYKMGSNNST